MFGDQVTAVTVEVRHLAVESAEARGSLAGPLLRPDSTRQFELRDLKRMPANAGNLVQAVAVTVEGHHLAAESARVRGGLAGTLPIA